MKIAFYAQEGSSSFIFDPRDVHGRGLGGAELSLVTLAQTLAAMGHQVIVYNQPPQENVYDGVTYLHTARFDPLESFDHFILYRNPIEPPELLRFISCPKTFFSCDQQTAGDYARDVFPYVDHTVCISEYHKQYFVDRYGADPTRITPIDLGVRTWEYNRKVAKVPNSLLYCSIPDRGLEHLAKLFPIIKCLVPDATLHITSSYALWGAGIPDSNERFRKMFEGMDGVTFHSKVSRDELVDLQLSCDIMAYPNQPVGGFAELFGVSVAECQVAGCVPVTSKYGAFETTVIHPYGRLITNCVPNLHPSEAKYGTKFVETIVGLLSNRFQLKRDQHDLSLLARERFGWQNIAEQWLFTLASVRRLPMNDN